MGYLRGELDLHAALDSIMAGKMPKQRDFVASDAFATAYVGGVGNGKTVALCVSCILNAANDPNGLSLVGRLNMPALEKSTLKSFLEIVPETYGEWQESKQTWVFENGHEVIFRHLDISDPKVVGHVRSLNLSAAYIDEASEVSEEVYYLLVGRLRRKTAPRRLIRLVSNPAGHDWMWRQFFDPQRNEKMKSMNRGITGSTMENIFLPPEYLQNMLNTYPPDWQDRFIHGSFADFSDLVFKEFSEHTHVWDETKHHAVFGDKQNPPEDWPVIVGMDIGGGEEGDPWAIPLISVAPDGRLYQFAEIYGSGLRIAPIAEEMTRLMEGRTMDGLAFDYAQRAAYLELEEHGISGVPAIKEVRPGLFKTEQYIHIDPRLEHPFREDVAGSPRYFVSASCKNTIHEMSAYKWAKDRSGKPKVPAEPAHENSHCPSAIRYAIHTFRPSPVEIKTPEKWENPKIDVASRLYWQRAAEREEKEQSMKWLRSSFSSRRRIVRERAGTALPN